MNSGLEKIPEFISEKGDFGDGSYRYIRQDENHKCGNQHFQDFAAVCQLHDPACKRHEKEQSRQQIRQDRGEGREEDAHPLRQNQQQKQWTPPYTKISSDLMISSAQLRMLFIRRTHSS